jgi:dinuclear metal center YbgI/SA1388 family protein
MQVRDVIAAVDRLAPFALAEPWDHVGLQVGAAADELRCGAEGSADVAPVVLVALEVDDGVLDEAARLGARVVVSHHPLIFDPLESLSDDTEEGRLALRAAREGVAVIAAHTSLDKARGGMADIVAGMLGLEAVQPLQPAAADVLKLVGFVPEDDADLVRKALFASGAGVIGEYEHCSWSAGGQGTFFGREESTSPAAGAAGRDEKVDELRLEVQFPRRLRRRVIGAYIAAHPYEEPAFDIVPLENEIASLGLGRLGALPAPATLAALAADVAAVLRLPSVRYAGDAGREVRRVAVIPGSGAEAIARGVAQVADVLITGDVKYHDARAAQAQGLALIDAPHGVTEQEGVLRWAVRLADALGAGATVETWRNPLVAVWSDSGDAMNPVPPVRAAAPEAPAAPAPAAPAPVAPAPAAPAPAAATSTPAAKPAPPEGVHSANRDDERFRLYTDGGARGNPGPAGIGARLMTAGGDVVEDVSDYIGKATNNVAEYQALIAGLEVALDRGIERLDVFLDSELVVRQVNGQYKVKDAGLKPLHAQTCLLLSKFHEVDVRHVRREQNSAADALVNQAIDAATG